MGSQHIWTEKDEQDRKREVRVTKFAGAWRFQAKRADEDAWTYYAQPLPDDLRTLREIIFRKYQRRRATAEELASVEKLLRENSIDE